MAGFTEQSVSSLTQDGYSTRLQSEEASHTTSIAARAAVHVEPSVALASRRAPTSETPRSTLYEPRPANKMLTLVSAPLSLYSETIHFYNGMTESASFLDCTSNQANIIDTKPALSEVPVGVTHA